MKQQANNMTVETVTYKKRRQLPEVWRRFKKNKRAVVGAILVIVILLAGVLAPFLTPYDPYTQDLMNMNQSPSMQHLCGTDNYGRDIFTRILYGARISMIVGWIAVLTSCLLGGTLGAIAGYYGGRVDNVIMRFMDIFLAIPNILLNISITAALGGGLVNMLIAMGVSSTPTYCRTLRAEIMKVRDQEFVKAARAAGSPDMLIIIKHIIPNCLAPMIVRITMSIGSAILSCASLSFIGLGISPPTAEWGSMLSSGREFIRTAPHICTFPGIAIMITVLALNLMGDGIRDAFDPKMKT